MSEAREEFPEHAKLRVVQPLSQACGAFLDWLEEQGLSICEMDASGTRWPVQRSKERLLAEHFDIDLNKLEAEKRAMLAKLNPAFGE